MWEDLKYNPEYSKRFFISHSRNLDPRGPKKKKGLKIEYVDISEMSTFPQMLISFWGFLNFSNNKKQFVKGNIESSRISFIFQNENFYN